MHQRIQENSASTPKGNHPRRGAAADGGAVRGGLSALRKGWIKTSGGWGQNCLLDGADGLWRPHRGQGAGRLKQHRNAGLKKHSRNHFILRLKFVIVIIKKGEKGPNSSTVTESNNYNSPTVEKHVLCCKKPLAHLAASDLTELCCGWNGGDRKRLHVVGGFFFVPSEHQA